MLYSENPFFPVKHDYSGKISIDETHKFSDDAIMMHGHVRIYHIHVSIIYNGRKSGKGTFCCVHNGEGGGRG